MQYTLKDYVGELKEMCSGKYLEYYDENSGEKFTNAEYFIFDTICEEFQAIMRSTGGFTANMTTRMIEKLNIPCESIMLCCSPSHNNTFLFQFVYLDENRNVLHTEWDNNYFDYKYFKKKFSPCTIQSGCVFDLKKYDYLEEVTNHFKEPSVHFDIQVDGREVTAEDVLVCNDLCLVREDKAEQMEHDYKVTGMELTFVFDEFNSAHYTVKFVREDRSYMPKYQALLEYKTLEEFIEDCGESDKEFYLEPYVMAVPVKMVRHFADHFSLKEKEVEDIER